jgi:protein SDA1
MQVELYKRNVWRDAKTVNVISTACFSKQFKVVATALRFFLGVTTAEDEDDHEADKGVAIKQLLADAASMQNSKHKKKRQRKLDRSVDKIKREEREREEKNILGSSDVGAIRLVYDPTSFTEKLFRSLTTGGHPFDLKLLLMNTISRFIGCHKLFILNFYPHLQKYMQPSQKNVTAILVYLAQVCRRLPLDLILSFYHR